MYGDLVEFIEGRLEYLNGLNFTDLVGREIKTYYDILAWVNERRSNSYLHKCQMEMESKAKNMVEIHDTGCQGCYHDLLCGCGLGYDDYTCCPFYKK